MTVLDVAGDEADQSRVGIEHLFLLDRLDASDQLGPARKNFHRHLEFRLILRAVVVSDGHTGLRVRAVQRLIGMGINELDEKVLIIFNSIIVEDRHLDRGERLTLPEIDDLIDGLEVVTGLGAAIDCPYANGAGQPLLIGDIHLQRAATLGTDVMEAAEPVLIVILLVPILDVPVEKLAELSNHPKLLLVGPETDILSCESRQPDLGSHSMIDDVCFLQLTDSEASEQIGILA